MVRKLILSAVILSICGAVLSGVWLWVLARTLPEAGQLAGYKPPITSRVHAGDGRLVAEFARQNRAYVPIEELPQRLIDAFISAEDKHFFDHFGLDPVGIFRAALRTIGNKISGRGGLQGGSTITQQVAKNMLLSNEQTLMRKIKEAMIALRIEKIFSKHQILELYMNEIYLGGRSYGVGAASLNYFNKSLSDLTLAECALLAALPKAPGSVNPYVRPEAARARRDWVIGRMHANGYIEEGEALAAASEALTTVSRLKGEEIKASRYFVEEVRREILKLYDTPEQGERALYEGGLSIRSTLDTRLQLLSRRVLWAGLESYDRRRGWRGPEGMMELGEGWQERLEQVEAPAGSRERGWSKAVVLESGESVVLGLSDGESFELELEDREWVWSSIERWREQAVQDRQSWEEKQAALEQERLQVMQMMERRAGKQAWAQVGIWEQEGDYGEEVLPEARLQFSPSVQTEGLASGSEFPVDGSEFSVDGSEFSEAAAFFISDGMEELSVSVEGEKTPPDFDVVIPPDLGAGQIVLVSRELPGDLNDRPILQESPAEPGEDQPWRLQQLPEVEGGMVVMDPHTGRILALTGGYSFERSQFNRAVRARRQPGSSFKPFVYAAALDKGFTPVSKILDAPFVIDTRQGLYKPRNYSDSFYGLSTLRLGVEKSRNLMTVRLAQEIGMEAISDYGRRFGLYERPMTFLSAALGAGETTPIKMAAAYSMLVNGGKRVWPTLLDRTQDREGRTVFQRDSRKCASCDSEWAGQDPPHLPDTRSKVLDPITAYQIVSMLEGVIHRGTAQTVLSVGKPVAGKTGTTNDYIDAWFAGFSPDLVVCVWVGFDLPSSLGDGESGGRIAAPIFRDFMKIALEEAPGAPFRIPPGVRLVEIDVSTGELARPSTRKRILEAFRPGSEPSLQRAKVRNINDDDDWIRLMRQGADYSGRRGSNKKADLKADPAPKRQKPADVQPDLSLDEGVY